MKIAQITSVYISVPPKTHGGTERIVYYLCRDLKRRGHHVELFASGDSKVDCTLQAVLPIASQDNPGSTFYLEKEYEARNTYNLYRQGDRFDVIHAHWTTIAPYFSDLTTTPTLITYAYIEKELHEYYKKHFPHCLPVCVSRAQARMLGDESIPVVYNGVDLDDIAFNDKPDDFFIIVGRMTPEKGIAEAIRIANKARAKLLVIGHVTTHIPWSEPYFLKEVKPHIDGDKIRYIERLAYRDLVQMLGKAKAFLFPLQWDEARATGTPVITARCGSVPEVVEDGVTGILCDSVEEMALACGQIETLDRAHCRNWVQEHFSVGKMVDGYERLYKTAASGQRSQKLESKPNDAW